MSEISIEDDRPFFRHHRNSSFNPYYAGGQLRNSIDWLHTAAPFLLWIAFRLYLWFTEHNVARNVYLNYKVKVSHSLKNERVSQPLQSQQHNSLPLQPFLSSGSQYLLSPDLEHRLPHHSGQRCSKPDQCYRYCISGPCGWSWTGGIGPWRYVLFRAVHAGNRFWHRHANHYLTPLWRK